MDEKTFRKGTAYPEALYATMDADGTLRLFTSDPLFGDAEEVSLSTVISSTFGTPDDVNVVKLQLRGIFLQRGEEFNLSIPGKIRNGMDAHVRDREGRVVEILEYASDDPAFPLQGDVIDQKTGQKISMRMYSPTGLCSDGDAKHSLVVINGAVDATQGS